MATIEDKRTQAQLDWLRDQIEEFARSQKSEVTELALLSILHESYRIN